MFRSLVFKFSHKFNSAVQLDLEVENGTKLLSQMRIPKEKTRRVEYKFRLVGGAAFPSAEGMVC